MKEIIAKLATTLTDIAKFSAENNTEELVKSVEQATALVKEAAEAATTAESEATNKDEEITKKSEEIAKWANLSVSNESLTEMLDELKEAFSTQLQTLTETMDARIKKIEDTPGTSKQGDGAELEKTANPLVSLSKKFS